jgi:hypothetical protein
LLPEVVLAKRKSFFAGQLADRKIIASPSDMPRFMSSPRRRPQHQPESKETRLVNQDINVLALVKGEERYIFLFDDTHRTDALRTLGRFASNPELSFSWYDAAVLSQRIRQQAAEPAPVAPPHASSPRFELPSNDTSRDAS